MSNLKIFKRLIDFLFFSLCIGILSLFIILPTGMKTIGQENQAVNDWELTSWIILLLSLVAYILLIIGVWNLKNTARHMLDQGNFNVQVSKYLKKSGISFILSSICSYIMFAVYFFKTLISDNQLQIIIDNNILLQILITILGLFFIIQSNVIRMATQLKAENDLTI